jgi:hypothetical protein
MKTGPMTAGDAFLGALLQFVDLIALAALQMRSPERIFIAQVAVLSVGSASGCVRDYVFSSNLCRVPKPYKQLLLCGDA